MTLLLGRSGTLGGEELEERRLERSLHVDEEIVGITEKYVTVTELLGRKEKEEEEAGSAMPSSLQVTLGAEMEEEEKKDSAREVEDHSEIGSQESLHVGKAIVKTSNR